jgi:hypothetical protein
MISSRVISRAADMVENLRVQREGKEEEEGSESGLKNVKD